MTETAQPPDDQAAEAPTGPPRGRPLAVGRVVFVCAHCNDVVSWPVSPERRRRNAEVAPPDPGRYRTVQRTDGSEVFVLHTSGARVGPGRPLKQARTCDNGHYIGDLREAPHAAPWQFEIPADNVSRRRLRVD